MAKQTKIGPGGRQVEALTHDEASRINNPTAEMASLYEQQVELTGEPPAEMRVPRDRPLAEGQKRLRNHDRDPQIIWNGVKISLSPAQMRALSETGSVEIGDAQLVWRGKDQQDWSDLVVNAPPLYIQEKIHPKAIIDDLKRRAAQAREAKSDAPDLFADFNGLDDPEARAEFYQHSLHWQNRMILGDSLQVMASLAEREALRGKVQCIYFDPPYGIKFNSNWQVSTRSRDVKDGKADNVTREPEQVKAFRDTWKDGIHSYLTYLRDRFTIARELLTESGSIFVQIGDENVHRVRALMDEVFGAETFVNQIGVKKTSGAGSPAIGTNVLAAVTDHVLWYCKRLDLIKYRRLYHLKVAGAAGAKTYNRLQSPDGGIVVSMADGPETQLRLQAGWRLVASDNITSQTGAETTRQVVDFKGRQYDPGRRGWSTNALGMKRLLAANRVMDAAGSLRYVRGFDDFPIFPINNWWEDGGTGSFTEDKLYVVQTAEKIVQRCILMTTDPGDLVLDPTCGSGTTAAVAELWGRRWITIDTSRVALALARTRLMSARYPFYLLADSLEGRAKEAELTKRIQPSTTPHSDIRQGFVLERAPHVTLKSIANNAEIDVIWERWQAVMEPLQAELNAATGLSFDEWQIPRDAAPVWSEPAKTAHGHWWEGRIERQKEIDASIARAADVELLYDRPYEDKSKVRVAGPFTVESLSPHRVVTARDDTLIDELDAVEGRMQPGPKNVPEPDFGAMVLDHLRRAGVHQQAKADTIRFASLDPWVGTWIAAEGRYTDADGREKRAAVLIGPEFGTLSRSAITAAAREASEARFDALIACAFNFDAQASDLNRLGPLPILKARMNPDLHMAEDLKNTGKGNLFVVFGEPDVTLIETPAGEVQVKVNGVDVFDPATGDIRSDGVDGIACWFIDTDYNEESFFVRHAYFLGANDPYKSLKTALKAEIDEDAWATLYSDTSRPFPRPSTGRIAVKVINHFGDEVLKVFGV